MNTYKNILEPLKIRNVILKNRIVFGAHTANMSENGIPGDQHFYYYLERAKGGAGMIVVEPQPVHRTAVLTRGNFLVNDDGVVSGFKRITEACKNEGAVILQQLYHIGQHGDADLSFAPNWSPSGQPSYHDSDGSRAMRVSEIEEIISSFGQAAFRCKQAGFDGVEVWTAYHSLIEQFWRPWSNKRNDEWGGPLENRMRLGLRIIEEVRKTCGEEFIVGLSISYAATDPMALSIDEIVEICTFHESTGSLDYITCGSGSYLEHDKVMPTFIHGEKPTVDSYYATQTRINKYLCYCGKPNSYS